MSQVTRSLFSHLPLYTSLQRGPGILPESLGHAGATWSQAEWLRAGAGDATCGEGERGENMNTALLQGDNTHP